MCCFLVSDHHNSAVSPLLCLAGLFSSAVFLCAAKAVITVLIIPDGSSAVHACICRGQIPAQFKLLPFDSPYASKFSFRPREGTLDVGEVKTIRVQLQSDLLGTFSDTFTWSLNGSLEALKLQFKGSIVGPKYKV